MSGRIKEVSGRSKIAVGRRDFVVIQNKVVPLPPVRLVIWSATTAARRATLLG